MGKGAQLLFSPYFHSSRWSLDSSPPGSHLNVAMQNLVNFNLVLF